MITPSFGLTATERVLPKLALDFTTGALDSRITFTRTTSATNPATYTNSSGLIVAATNNQPRFDYDPITLVCKGLLIEESRTNFAYPSSNYESAARWTKYGTATASASAVLAPDSTTTATLLSNATSMSYGGNNIGVAVTTGLGTGATVSATYYVKASTATTASIGIRDSSTGSITTATLSLTSQWQRLSVTKTLGASTTGCMLMIGGMDGDAYVCFAQLEIGAFSTSFIPTTTVTGALTRNADVAVMTGTNFSDWYSASQGMFRVDASTPASGTRSLISADDNTSGNSIVMSTVSTAPKLVVTQSSAEQANVAAGTITANTAMFAYASYAANYFGIARPSARQVDTSGTVPTVDRLRIGTDQAGNYANGIIRAIQFWP